MFTTVKEVHIGIELGLQQLNSNRKQALLPEYYDYTINTVLLDYVNEKIDAKANKNLEGFEDSQKRVDELRELKRKRTLNFIVDTAKRSYIILPSNYYRLIPGSNVNLHYNKRLLNTTESNIINYVTTMNFASNNFSAFTNFNTVVCTINGNAFSFTKSLTNINSRFEVVNAILSYFRNFTGFDIYWEYYNDSYYKDKFIVVSTTNVSFTLTATSFTPTKVTTNVARQIRTSSGNKIDSPIDLVPSDIIQYAINTETMSQNRHKQPLCELSNDKLYCYNNTQFRPLSIELTYLKRPNLINYYTNSMPDISITSEIINRCVDKFKIYIKDEQAYNMFLNEINKVK